MADNHIPGPPEPLAGTVDPEEYQHLLEDYSHLAPPSRHEVLEGRIIKISQAGVFIDVGYKSDGMAPLAEFTDADGKIAAEVGDVVEVMIERGQTSEGYVLLSHEKAARLKIWDQLEKAMEEQLTISGLVVGRVKGGLSVDVGVRAFMPGSQIDVRPLRNLEQLNGQYVPVKIVKLNRKRGNVVVSRKLAVQEEVDARKNITLEQLHDKKARNRIIVLTDGEDNASKHTLDDVVALLNEHPAIGLSIIHVDSTGKSSPAYERLVGEGRGSYQVVEQEDEATIVRITLEVFTRVYVTK